MNAHGEDSPQATSATLPCRSLGVGRSFASALVGFEGRDTKQFQDTGREDRQVCGEENRDVFGWALVSCKACLVNLLFRTPPLSEMNALTKPSLDSNLFWLPLPRTF